MANVSEEAGEIVQAVGKAQRFGMDSKCPKTLVANRDQLVREINDLHGVIELVNECLIEQGLPPLEGIGDRAQIDAKKDKVVKRAIQSVQAGTLSVAPKPRAAS